MVLSGTDLVKLDGSDPLLLEAYGAYGSSFDPEFSGMGLPPACACACLAAAAAAPGAGCAVRLAWQQY